MSTPNPLRHLFRVWIRTGRVVSPLALLILTMPLHAAVPADSGSRGVISGNVSNAGTGNLLEGARVDVPALGLSTYTDNTGRFVLSNVPAGIGAIP